MLQPRNILKMNQLFYYSSRSFASTVSWSLEHHPSSHHVIIWVCLFISFIHEAEFDSPSDNLQRDHKRKVNLAVRCMAELSQDFLLCWYNTVRPLESEPQVSSHLKMIFLILDGFVRWCSVISPERVCEVCERSCLHPQQLPPSICPSFFFRSTADIWTTSCHCVEKNRSECVCVRVCVWIWKVINTWVRPIPTRLFMNYCVAWIVLKENWQDNWTITHTHIQTSLPCVQTRHNISFLYAC